MYKIEGQTARPIDLEAFGEELAAFHAVVREKRREARANNPEADEKDILELAQAEITHWFVVQNVLMAQAIREATTDIHDSTENAFLDIALMTSVVATFVRRYEERGRLFQSIVTETAELLTNPQDPEMH